MTTTPVCTVAAPPARPRLWKIAAATALLLVTAPLAGAFAAPVVDGGSASTPVYVEQAAPVAVGSNVTVTGGTSYAGQFVEFSVAAGDTSDVLSLLTSASPVVTAGVVSVVGGSVYLGNGTSADPVGSVDPSLDGTSGQPLRVNFTSAFDNAGFESSDLTGWTAINNRIDLGVTSIAGFVATDTSTYPGNTPNQDNNAPMFPGSYTSTVTGSASEGSYALELTSSGMTTAQGCDVVHGPGVYTAPFEAAAGDKIYFDWRAYAGADNYHVFGYIVDTNGVQTEVLDSTGPGTTPWASQETVIPAAGTYRFVFVAGTHDATCGQAAGASLQIDNVRVYGTKATDDVAQQVARLLAYSNTSDTPPASRTITILADSSSQGSGSGQVTVNITPVDDGPTLVAPSTDTFTNSEGAQTYANATGTLAATDPEGDPITYGLAGGVAQAATIGGVSYTHALVGTYGTARVNDVTGQYVFVPDASAIDARLVDDAESFTVTASSLGITSTASYTIAISVPDTTPGTPTAPAAKPGPEQVALTWTAPVWLGGSAIEGYVIESSTDGVLWTTLTDTGTDATSYTATGLTNGDAVSFRVSARNATGTGTASTPVTATPVDVAVAPTDLVALPGNHRVDLTWTAPTDTGGTPLTGYQIESSTDGTTWTTVVADTGSTATAFTATGLANGIPVTFRVSALNAVGAGPAGVPTTATPRTIPDAPVNLAATPGNEVVTLTWAAPLDDGGAPVTGYRVESSTDGTTWTTVVADTASTSPTYTVTSLANGTPVSFRVAAVNEAGVGAYSTVETATPRTTPGAPTITTVVGGN
ncbi:MAG: fibronectin type III domain-containing protein, partial [Ilumatobacteraceae bacterium]